MSQGTKVTSDKIHAFFDGEATADERAAVEAMLAEDPGARASLEEISLLRQAIVGSLEAEAERVPEARFEQIWDEVERTIVRDARLQQAADVNVSIWSRMGAFFRPLWAPAAAVVGVAAAVAVVFAVNGESEPPANTPAMVASNDAPQAPVEERVLPGASADEVIAAKLGVVELTSNNEAEIQRIEFGGKSGRIDRIEGKQGITTVIWVSEDDETTDSERSL